MLLVVCTLSAQTTKESIFSDIKTTAGTCYAYPVTKQAQTPAPSGYKAFYISHYGRHGSRFLTGKNDYKGILDIFEEARTNKVLTQTGNDVCSRLERIWQYAQNRSGDLSPLGVRQQRGIAERMYNSFPGVFLPGSKITARSTVVIRCILSMDAFCERLKELNPKLETDRDASQCYMSYMNYHSKESDEFFENGQWRNDMIQYAKSHINPRHLMSELFKDSIYVNTKVDSFKLMYGLFRIAGNMQDLDTDISFYDLFEKDELFKLFQYENFEFYTCYANSPLNNGLATSNERNLLKNIIECADKAVSENRTGADLRFGHDVVVTPLAAIMHLGTCDTSVNEPSEIWKTWSTFNVTPMAANIQLIFFRKKSSKNILVKFMLNEKEMAIPIKSDVFPFYHWKDVKSYYRTLY